jgi:hypothetical protein
MTALTLRDGNGRPVSQGLTRAERVEAARLLRAGGLKLREIAECMEAPISTVAGWVADPDGTKLRARKDSYRRPCAECGEPCGGSDRSRLEGWVYLSAHKSAPLARGESAAS